MNPTDLAIPILPSKSLPNTLAFYGRLGFKESRQNKLTIFMKCVLVWLCKKKPHYSQSNRGIAG